MPQVGQRVCKRCVLDSTVPGISFDASGNCNFCTEFEHTLDSFRASPKLRQSELEAILERIRDSGRGHDHDSVLGLSGGVDSSYVAHLAVEWGLRPLIVCADNGWDAEEATQNVANLVAKLGLDVERYAVDFAEFTDLQKAFLTASVQNIEIPTDHFILSVLYRTAAKHRIKFILSGGNVATEGILPRGFIGWTAWDARYIRGIHARFATRPLKTYPLMGYKQLVYYWMIKQVQKIRPLNYIDYHRGNAIDRLRRNYEWYDYGHKHFESIFTRFFQAYILPTKFGVDKRKAHFSTLIVSGQMSRDEALDLLKHSPYPNEEMLREDHQRVLEGLGLTEQEFDRLISLPVRTYRDYPSSSLLYKGWARLRSRRGAVLAKAWGIGKQT